MDKAIGKAIRDARLRKGLTQRQVAAALDVDPITVSRWERGEAMPEGGNLLAVRRFLGIDAARLSSVESKTRVGEPEALYGLPDWVLDFQRRFGFDDKHRAVLGIHQWLRSERKQESMDRAVLLLLRLAGCSEKEILGWERWLFGSQPKGRRSARR